MTRPKRTWREKHLVREENGSNTRSDGSKQGGETPHRREGGEDGSPDAAALDVNMVFIIPEEFQAPENRVAKLVLGAERVVFETLESIGKHMKPLYVIGHLDDRPISQMIVDGGASVNIIPLTTFQMFRHQENELKQTNLSLIGFSGEPAEAKGIVSKELTVGSKTLSIDFFVVDVKGRYNILLGCEWIHVNRCVPSTLHQCITQWVSDQVEVVEVDDTECIVVAKTQGGRLSCLTECDLTEYDYVSMGNEGFIPISVKSMIDTTRLIDSVVQ
jgi:hypothetical protein